MGLALIIALTFTILIFFLTSIAVFVTRNRNPRNAPVVVTSATHIGPGGYPVTQLPVGATNTTYQTQAYTAPYPPQGIPAQMPMPMPMPTHPPVAGVQPHLTMPAASMNPPSYDVAVSGAGAGQSNSNVYQQQPPYNPNYGM